MNTNTTAMPPIAPQPVPEPPKRLSPFRLLVPLLGAPMVSLMFGYVFLRSTASDCDGLACAGVGIVLFFVAGVLIPLGFAIAGAVWYKHDRIFAGLAWSAIALVASVGVLFAVGSRLTPTEKLMQYINDFEDCADRGYPVMESYPRQCRAPDGTIFVEEIADASVAPAPSYSDEPVACTADAFQCPDGSWVGRTGPRCEFVCP